MRVKNPRVWMVGEKSGGGVFKARRVVWGRMLARAERRAGEVVHQATLVPDPVDKRVADWESAATHGRGALLPVEIS